MLQGRLCAKKNVSVKSEFRYVHETVPARPVARIWATMSVFLFVTGSVFVVLIIRFFSMWSTACVSDSGCTQCVSLWV